MTVKELIKYLELFDSESQVYISEEKKDYSIVRYRIEPDCNTEHQQENKYVSFHKNRHVPAI
jgi:hypothetical protein